MPQKSKIGWTTSSWNPVTGCTKVSPGCDNCYAEALSERMRGTPAYPIGFDLQLRPHKLKDPIKWKKPARIFVNSMSDLFHKDIPDEYLQKIWATMLEADHHIYQILTKRAHRMAHKVGELGLEVPSHIWLGVSVENQKMADSRIPPLLDMGITVPWISAEPLIGPVDLEHYLAPSQMVGVRAGSLEWVVAGGESGPGRRHMDYDWVRAIRDQCSVNAVPFFHKQGNHIRPGRDRVLDGLTYDEYPAYEGMPEMEVEQEPEVRQGLLL